MDKKLVSVVFILAISSISILSLGISTASASSGTPALSCNYYFWFDNEHRTCGYKQFCGAYMYYGLNTFTSLFDCRNALLPTTTTTINSCHYYFWFDNQHRYCGFKKFCGFYMYPGLQTFGNFWDCFITLYKR